MKFPTEVKIKNTIYQIEYVDMPREVDFDLESTNYRGMIRYGNPTIRALKINGLPPLF